VSGVWSLVGVFFFAWLVGWLVGENSYGGYFSLYSFVFSYERFTSGLFIYFCLSALGEWKFQVIGVLLRTFRVQCICRR
jgi:hypothetical protein